MLEQFVAEIGEDRPDGNRFRCATARTLVIEVDGDVWLKPGAAIAHRGTMDFERRHTLAAQSVRDAVIREAAPLIRANGRGRLYCGHRGAHVTLGQLRNEALVVAWKDLLAFESSLEFDATLIGNGVGIAAGGLVAVTLRGTGAVALATHGQPLTLPVDARESLFTDPHATLAWSSSLTPRLRLDVSWRSLVAHGGQEPVQMQFDGTGFVVVHASGNPRPFAAPVSALKELGTLIGL